MKNLLRQFLKDDAGTTTVEYALIASLLSIAFIASAEAIAHVIQGLYGQVDTALASANTFIARR
ncbi:MAG: Flp family type IVb pilin [Alphaproteobacteria bacterium]|nr:Flp family type IVb pilin [Alphaproteobacteria bacterium]